MNSACQKLLFLLQISVQISKRPLQSTPRDTLLKHCSLSGKVLSISKGECHALALVKQIYIPWQYSNCGASHSGEGWVHLLSSLPKPFYGLISTEQTLLLGKYLCNLYLAHTGWEELWPQLRPWSTAQGGGRNSGTSPARHLKCPPAWCPEGFQWRTTQPPPCRTPPGAGDSASFLLGTSGQRWTRE